MDMLMDYPVSLYEVQCWNAIKDFFYQHCRAEDYFIDDME